MRCAQRMIIVHCITWLCAAALRLQWSRTVQSRGLVHRLASIEQIVKAHSLVHICACCVYDWLMVSSACDLSKAFVLGDVEALAS
jgi:hypothetical protein